MTNVAIVGLGNISYEHIKAYRTFPEECRIVAGVDINEGAARSRLETWGIDVPVYPSTEAMLDAQDVDLISICTPPFTHREIAVTALSRGVHVVCEKPMASSLEECDAMIEAERSSGKRLSIIAQNRFTTPIWNLRRLLDDGHLGRLLHVQINSYWWRGRPYYDLWWRGTWEQEGGGCTLNHAVHHIDMMLWIAGRPAHVMAMMGNVAHDNAEVEDISMAILGYDDRRFGQITSSVVHHGQRQEIILQGDRARASAPWIVDASNSAPNGFPEHDEAYERELDATMAAYGALHYEGHAGQIKDMLDAIASDRRPAVTSTDGRAAIELITAIYKSSTTRSQIDLPLDPGDPYYARESMLTHVPRFFSKESSVESLGDGTITLGSAHVGDA